MKPEILKKIPSKFTLQNIWLAVFLVYSVNVFCQEYPGRLFPDTVKSANIINSSQFIFEGEIVEAQSFFVEGEDFAYYRYLVRVWHVFRGDSLKTGLVEIVHGTHEHRKHGLLTDHPIISLNMAIIFFCNIHKGKTLDDAIEIRKQRRPPPRIQVDERKEKRNSIILTIAEYSAPSSIKELPMGGYVGLKQLFFKSYDAVIDFLYQFDDIKRK